MFFCPPVFVLFFASRPLHWELESLISLLSSISPMARTEGCDEYQDLRSEAQTLSRHRDAYHKYYGYRGVKPSWPGQKFLDISNSLNRQPWPCTCVPQVGPEGEARIRTWTKQDQYENREFDIWPLDRHHHVGRRRRRNCCYISPRQEDERKMKSRNRAKYELEEALELARGEASWSNGWDDSLTRPECQHAVDHQSVVSNDFHQDVAVEESHSEDRLPGSKVPTAADESDWCMVSMVDCGSEVDDNDWTEV